MLVKPGSKVFLKDFDPDDAGPYHGEEEVHEPLEKLRQELAKLQSLFYADRRFALLIILQGMDAAGKDGTIKHVMSGLNPLGVSVIPFKAPNEEELAHDFLWRVHKATPARGQIAIFNRSQYEDVLVVRVHELVPRTVWKRRYKQINHFEHILVENHTVLLKFFLHISKDEQKKRLQARLQDPTHYWKFSRRDVEERRYWPAYKDAYEDALGKCSTEWAPWHVVPANHKWYRNLVVAQTVVDALRGLKLRYPEPPEDVSKIVID
jgi:PPK2 family polyphosphate:nucleotide phosphotransferase